MLTRQESGVLWDPFIQTSSVRYYGEVADLRSARKMFDDIVDLVL